MKIRKECFPFFLPFVVLAIVLLKFNLIASAICWILAGFILYFFRDPDRTIPDNSENLILAPADGKIIAKRPVTKQEIEQFQTEPGATKLSIFLNVFNVHVNRAPISGIITEVIHRKGKKLPAFHEKSSSLNEHMDFRIQGQDTIICFRLIAGLVAQRIVSLAQKDSPIKAGQRIGLIKFGSRVDIIIPPAWDIQANLNEKTKAGETILAAKSNEG